MFKKREEFDFNKLIKDGILLIKSKEDLKNALNSLNEIKDSFFFYVDINIKNKENIPEIKKILKHLKLKDKNGHFKFNVNLPENISLKEKLIPVLNKNIENLSLNLNSEKFLNITETPSVKQLIFTGKKQKIGTFEQKLINSAKSVYFNNSEIFFDNFVLENKHVYFFNTKTEGTVNIKNGYCFINSQSNIDTLKIVLKDVDPEEYLKSVMSLDKIKHIKIKTNNIQDTAFMKKILFLTPNTDFILENIGFKTFFEIFKHADKETYLKLNIKDASVYSKILQKKIENRLEEITSEDINLLILEVYEGLKKQKNKVNEINLLIDFLNIIETEVSNSENIKKFIKEIYNKKIRIEKKGNKSISL